MYMYIYIYMCIHTCVCIYIYIYIISPHRVCYRGPPQPLALRLLGTFRCALLRGLLTISLHVRM